MGAAMTHSMGKWWWWCLSSSSSSSGEAHGQAGILFALCVFAIDGAIHSDLKWGLSLSLYFFFILFPFTLIQARAAAGVQSRRMVAVIGLPQRYITVPSHVPCAWSQCQGFGGWTSGTQYCTWIHTVSVLYREKHTVPSTVMLSVWCMAGMVHETSCWQHRFSDRRSLCSAVQDSGVQCNNTVCSQASSCCTSQARRHSIVVGSPPGAGIGVL